MNITPRMKELMDDYEIKKPSFLQKAREFVQSNTAVKIGMGIGVASIAALVGGACMEAHAQSEMLTHGIEALRAYEAQRVLTDVKLDSFQSVFDGMKEGGWTNQKTMIAGVVSGYAGIAIAGAGKLASMIGIGKSPERREMEGILMEKAHHKGPIPAVENLGETLKEYAQMGTVERIKNCIGKPGLLSLVNTFENYAREYPHDAERMSKVATHYQERGREDMNATFDAIFGKEPEATAPKQIVSARPALG